ncbi:MAG TPA: peptide chain release factor 3 [Melioribacteraceae bacterium]|nr:peptide chain release factor 3 [Melioribacteraceae bacterium]
MSIEKEINKRKTFAIISHPDAGKTTLTEKLLLYSGAINIAGAVKSNKITKTATSDFLEIEKQRGISVATSVLSFSYNGCKINLLDTPGHKDFAEDTYRTLTAVDSVILVIDCVKGVEEQTEKLMNVCRMRNTPVIIFINKLDREGRPPIELLDEIEAKLGINTRPMTWPLGIGASFKGVYNIYKNTFNFFISNKQKVEDEVQVFNGLDDPDLYNLFGSEAEKLKDDIELIDGVYHPYDEKLYQEGELSPVFFGSALNNFGIKELLDTFVTIAPAPKPRLTTEGMLQPTTEEFSGFVFKIQANLDPRHRDRIAFFRVCSGKFERNKFYHHVRLDRDIKFPNPASFMAQSKNLIEDAFPGDVIGLYDSNIFKIGDTLTEGSKYMFKGIPRFSPEIFRELRNTDPFKTKQLEKGISQLTDEGLAQLFIHSYGNRKVIGVVGELQFDVIKYRLLHEFGASCDFIPYNSYRACWVRFKDESDIEELTRLRSNSLFYDKNKNLVYIAETEFSLNMAKQKNPKAEFLFSIEHNDQTVEIEF